MQVFYQPVGIKQDWKLFDARCRLQPLADQLLSSNSSQTGSRVPILLIGDSTDRFIQQDVCELGKMVGARTDSIGFDTDHAPSQPKNRQRTAWNETLAICHPSRAFDQHFLAWLALVHNIHLRASCVCSAE